MITTIRTTVTINSSQVVHWGSEFGTMCGAGAGFGKKINDSQATTATCKRCVKLVALQVELAHAEAMWMDEERTMYRAKNGTPSSTVVEVSSELAHAEALEQNMALDATRRAVETADAITAHQIARAENMDRIVSEDWDAALVEQAQRGSAQTPRELDIWLTEGTVLVDPVTGDLMTFERWGSEGAQLRNQRTGAQHIVGQSSVVTWKYIPRPVEWNQVWREKATGVLVRIVDLTVSSVLLRGMEPADRSFWLGKDLLAELYVWAPEKAA